jgi:hypothetical protein
MEQNDIQEQVEEVEVVKVKNARPKKVKEPKEPKPMGRPRKTPEELEAAKEQKIKEGSSTEKAKRRITTSKDRKT